MQCHEQFAEASIQSIKPEGWLRVWLETQKRGLTGNMEAAGFPFNTRGWAAPSYTEEGDVDWVPYEQVGYWVDGALRCGLLLDDPALIEKAREHVDYTLSHPDRDGFLGNPELKKTENPLNRWPHAVFFRAACALCDATGDKEIISRLTDHYLGDDFPYARHRQVCNVEIMLWLYRHTGDRRLLQRACTAYEQFNELYPDEPTSVKAMLLPEPHFEHGVTYNEIGKLGAVLYRYTGKKRYLDATRNAWRKIDKYFMLVDGVHSSTEFLIGNSPLDSHETCVITDYVWSTGYLLMTTGEAAYGDKIERAAFNAAPGAVTKDFRALQYFSSPNQVVADRTSHHSTFMRGHQWASYRPNPGTECCPGEVNRVMPAYACRMWMRGARGEAVAALYGPSRHTFSPPDSSTPVTIVEETAYPFSERIDFSIRTQTAQDFTLQLRIPEWCDTPSPEINGKKQKREMRKGTFFSIARTFSPNDRIVLRLPMTVRASCWGENGLAPERGPLVFALPVKEERHRDEKDPRQTPEFPAWNMYPASRWNYALDIDPADADKEAVVKFNETTAMPWTSENPPVEIWVPARKVSGWRLKKRKTVYSKSSPHGALEKHRGDFTFTPPLPPAKGLPQRLAKKRELIRLVPYGATCLRLTIFPTVRVWEQSRTRRAPSTEEESMAHYKL